MHPGGVLGHRAGAGRTLAAAWSATAWTAAIWSAAAWTAAAWTDLGERTRE